MPENSTEERIRTMRAYGAKVILTPSHAGMEGTIDEARRRLASGGRVMLDQFGNDDNWRAHLEGTGPEILRDAPGITHFVSAMGTTGTIMGVSRALRESGRSVEIVGCQPTEGSRIPGIRRWPREYLPRIFDPTRVDRTIDVSQGDAENGARDLARRAGVFTGPSAAGAWHVACGIAESITEGTIVTILCDRGDRYVSSDVFGPDHPNIGELEVVRWQP
ncbi:MAG: pyridoxal-phosphate dependent enzyme, partial [Armatimonadota bacterium]